MIRQGSDTTLVPPAGSSRLTAADVCLLGVIGLVLTGSCVVRSHGKLYWSDELLGIQVLGDTSFTHMFVGWREGADGGGFFYYLFARLWLDLVGISELTLRLFSNFGLIVSMICVWIIGRRYYGTMAMAVSVSLVYLTTPVLIWQTFNGRFYGFLLAAAALASLAYFKTAESDTLSWADLCFVMLCHALLCGSHILGMIYSAVLIVAMFSADLVGHRLRPRPILAALAGWIILPFSYRAIVNSTGIASKVFWTQKPHLTDLMFAVFLFNQKILIATVLFLMCWAVTAALGRRTSRKVTNQPSPHSAIYIFAGALLLAEIVLFIKSRLFGVSIFADRYLIPLSLGVVLVLAELCTRAFPYQAYWQRRYSKVSLLAAVLGVILATFLGSRLRPYAAIYPAQGLAQRLASYLPPDKTVLVTRSSLFLFLTHYEPTHHYVYPLDPLYDMSPGQIQKNHSSPHLMENWRRAGYDTPSILSCTQILQEQPSFTVLANSDQNDWVAKRLASPTYDTRILGESKEWSPFTVYHSTLRGAPAACD